MFKNKRENVWNVGKHTSEVNEIKFTLYIYVMNDGRLEAGTLIG